MSAFDDLLSPSPPNTAGLSSETPYADTPNLNSFGDTFDAELAQKKAADDEDRRKTELVSKARAEFTWFKMERERYVDTVWNDCYKTFRLQVPDERKTGEWRSKLNVPTAFISVEDAVPHLMEGLWGADRPFRLKAAGDDSIVTSHESLLYWEVNELMDMEPKWEQGQRQKAIYGTTASYTGFRIKYRTARRWKTQADPAGVQEPVAVMETQRVPEYIGTTFEIIDIYNLYVHPRATPDAPIKIYWRQFLSRAQLEMYPDRFTNLDKLTDDMSESGGAASSLIGERQWRTGQANNTGTYPNEKLFQVVTCYDDIAKKVYSFIFNGGLLIEEGDYPFFHDQCPINFERYTELPLEFWGMGVIEPNLSLIHERNAIRNMRRDNANLIGNAIIEVKTGGFEDEEEELVFAPGEIWHSRDGQSARFLQPPAVLQNAYEEENMVSQDMERVTGLGGPLSGQAQDGVDSGVGTSLLQKAQLLRLSRAIKREALAFKKILFQMLALNVQFLPLKEVQSVLGAMHFKDYVAPLTDDLVLRTTIMVQPAGIYENEDVLRQQFTNLLNILGANPLFSQKVDWDYLLNQVLKLYKVQDVTLALKSSQGLNVLEAMFAFEENQEMAAGKPVPPATAQDDYDTHMAAHRQLLLLRPDLWQPVGQHMVSHDQAKFQAAQMAAQQQMQAAAGQGGPQGGPPQGGPPQGQQGPGSPPPGAQGGQGGLNPNRQPQASGPQSINKAQSRMAPRVG